MPDRSNPPVLPPPPPPIRRGGAVARGLERDAFGREIAPPPPQNDAPPADPAETASKPRETATDAIGRRAGALSDELDFPAFVSSLVHGTFDAIVDSTIRQMESFADLVAAVAKPLDQFTQENVSPNQARDYLVEQYPKDLALVHTDDGVHVAPRANKSADGDDEARTPDWLADYGLAGEELTPELIEEQILPKARQRVATNRLQTLSTMVLLGMNRVIVKDGSIGARLRFRAAAADHVAVDYAVSDGGDEPPSTEWGRRGSRTYDAPKTKVSTVGVNVQSDSELKAELFGDVKINFASETVPLDRFVDDARRNVLERHARPTARATAPAAAQPPAAPALLPVAAAPALAPQPGGAVAAPVPAAAPPPGGTR